MTRSQKFRFGSERSRVQIVWGAMRCMMRDCEGWQLRCTEVYEVQSSYKSPQCVVIVVVVVYIWNHHTLWWFDKGSCVSLPHAPYSLLLTPCSLLLAPYSLLLTPHSLLLTPYCCCDLIRSLATNLGTTFKAPKAPKKVRILNDAHGSSQWAAWAAFLFFYPCIARTLFGAQL